MSFEFLFSLHVSYIVYKTNRSIVVISSVQARIWAYEFLLYLYFYPLFRGLYNPALVLPLLDFNLLKFPVFNHNIKMGFLSCGPTWWLRTLDALLILAKNRVPIRHHPQSHVLLFSVFFK